MLTANSIKNARYLRVAKEMLDSIEIHTLENQPNHPHSLLTFHVHNAEGKCMGLSGMGVKGDSENFVHLIKFILSTFIIAGPSCNFNLKEIRQVLDDTLHIICKKEDEEMLKDWLKSSETEELYNNPPPEIVEKYPASLERLQYFKSMILGFYVDNIFDLIVTTEDTGTHVSNYIETLKNYLQKEE